MTSARAARGAAAVAVGLMIVAVGWAGRPRPVVPDLPPGDTVTVALLLAPGPQRDAALLAIDEINAYGGPLGRRVRVVDDPAPGSVAAFGCGRPVPATPLFCPDDAAPADFSTGATPNQRVIPALAYLVSRGLTAIHLVVGDDELSRHTAEIVRTYARTGAVTVTGQSRGWSGRPTGQAVLSTLDGADSARFFAAYAAAGLAPDRLPVLSLALSEADIATSMAGQFVAGGYFRDLPGRANAAFVAALRQRYGPQAPIAEPAQSAYVAVYVWRAMVARAGSFRPEKMAATADGLVLDAPEGRVAVDGARHHLYRTARIGRVEPDGRVTEVWNTGGPVRPDPGLLGYPWARPAA